MPIEHLPEQMKPPAYRLRDWCLTVGPALIFLGVNGFVRGLAYIPGVMEPITRPLHPVENVAPMSVWGWVWVAASIFALVAAFWQSRFSPWGIGLLAGLNGVWFCSYFLDAIFAGHLLNLVFATHHLSIAGLALWAVWRGVREPKPTSEEVAHELRDA